MPRNEWFTLKKGKVGISQNTVIEELMPEVLERTEAGQTLGQIAEFLREEVRQEADRQDLPINENALNKTSGAWNESIMEVHFEKAMDEINQALPAESGKYVAIRMPNGGAQGPLQSYSRFMDLFCPEEYQKGGALAWFAGKLDSIYFPSPDVVIAKTQAPANAEQISRIITSDTVQDTHHVYHSLEGRLRANQVYGTVSLKTSTRSDRRYQAMYEAEMVKAVAHRAGIDWRCGFITSGQEAMTDVKIYRTGVSIQAIWLGDPDLRFADAWRFHERQEGLTEWLEDFLRR